MESKFLWSSKQDYPEELPSLFQYIASHSVAGFDNFGKSGGLNNLCQLIETPTTNPSPDYTSAEEAQLSASQSHGYSLLDCLSKSSVPAVDLHKVHSISISMPSSPDGFQLEKARRVLFSNEDRINANHETTVIMKNSFVSNSEQQKVAKFYSQPLPAGCAYAKAVAEGRLPNNLEQQQRNMIRSRRKDIRFDSLKTLSGTLERQLSNLRGKQPEVEPDINDSQNAEIKDLPVDRYLDALEGPELDTLRASEELALPEDQQWPFLLRFPISSFGMCLGISSQAILWKTLATSPCMRFLHISLSINLVLWCISIALIVIIVSIYSLKVIFYFEAVRHEYHHPVRVNFFFAPWIALLFLALGVPPHVAKNLPVALWYVLMAPILFLELKIYGQWMSGGQRRLSKVANPSNHLSIVGNFVGALLGASMGLNEGPIFFFAIGMAHYTVLFVTLYQRLPTNETLPKELHPVFFLFVAAPSIASMAWARIQGEFDYGSRIAYFIALFLYISLVVRVNFFRGFRFSLAWWAYTFPMTSASIATIKYSNVVKNPFTQSLSVVLSAISTLIVTTLLVCTFVHGFVRWDLFPNDVAIAITERWPKGTKKHSHLQSMSLDT